MAEKPYHLQFSPSMELGELWRQSPAPEVDLFLRGTQYLQAVRTTAISPTWIELPGNSAERLQACRWIGCHIHRINQHLFNLVQDCLTGFHPARRVEVQILAAPIAPYAALDGFCNYQANPITIVVDPSRTQPEYWLRLVAHEVAHAMNQLPGHGAEFLATLTQLCIAQDLPLPPSALRQPNTLCTWPPYPPNPQKVQFWQGQIDELGYPQ